MSEILAVWPACTHKSSGGPSFSSCAIRIIKCMEGINLGSTNHLKKEQNVTFSLCFSPIFETSQKQIHRSAPLDANISLLNGAQRTENASKTVQRKCPAFLNVFLFVCIRVYTYTSTCIYINYFNTSDLQGGIWFAMGVYI